MLEINRENHTLSRIDTSSLAEAQILERADLQECIYWSLSSSPSAPYIWKLRRIS